MTDTSRAQILLPGEVNQHVETLRGVMARVSPDSMTPAEAAEMWDGFDQIERFGSIGKLQLAARTAESKRWKVAGCRTPAEHMAQQSGSSKATAERALWMSRRLERCPGVAAALKAGTISIEQAAIIAKAVIADPSCESDMLAAAGRVPLFQLAEKMRSIRAATNPNHTKTHQRIHEERCLRRHTDAEGACHLWGHGPVEDAALLMRAIGPLIDELLEQARLEGRDARYDAITWDALHEFIRRALSGVLDTNTNTDADAGNADQQTDPDTTSRKARRRSRSNRKYMTLIKVDIDKLRDTKDPQGRYVEMPGVGTVPLSIAEDMFPDSILNLVLTSGVDVVNVTNLSRKPTAAQHVKLLWEQGRCSNQACARSVLLETDHRKPWAHVHRTDTDNLDHYCKHCHWLKTYEGWELIDGTGPRAFVPPIDPRHPQHKLKTDAA